MNRTQKKCLIATTGGHVLLVLVVVFGSAFFVSHSKVDPTEVLTILPDNVVDGPSSGVRNPQQPPPNPTPPQQPQQPQQPPQLPEPPKPVKPVRQQKLTEDEMKPVDKGETPTKPQPKKIEISFKKVVKNVQQNNPDAEAEAQRQAQLTNARRKQQAIANAVSSISQNASSSTEVEMPGDSSVSFANYAAYVKATYDRAWEPSNDISDDDGVVAVSVTISSDGSVKDSHVVTASGDARLNASVKKALNRVTFVHEFPEGAKEKEKTFIINFNLKAKRMLG